MKLKIGLFVLATCGAASLFAQEMSYVPTMSFKVGIPVTDMFDASNTSQFGGNTLVPGSTFTSAVPRYEFGLGAEFHLPKHLRFEVDGLYKRGGFGNALTVGGATAYGNTTFNQWEIPGLFKANIAMGHFRPFVDFGASLRHISTITDTNFAAADFNGFTSNNNSPYLHNRNSFGGVAGFGMTFKKGPFELTPEARYTRWANQSFLAPGLRTNLDQGDVLLGIGF